MQNTLKSSTYLPNTYNLEINVVCSLFCFNGLVVKAPELSAILQHSVQKILQRLLQVLKAGTLEIINVLVSGGLSKNNLTHINIISHNKVFSSENISCFVWHESYFSFQGCISRKHRPLSASRCYVHSSCFADSTLMH